MKKTIMLLVILILASLFFTACSGSQGSQGNGVSSSPSTSEEGEDNDDGLAIDDPNNPVNMVDLDFVIEALQNPDEWVVIDVRTPEEFNGESRLPNAYGSGRIKGAINVNRELVYDARGEIRPQDELMELYEFIGDKKAIVYCHGGVRSAFVWSILYDLGFEVKNYSGSWIDWSTAATVANGEANALVLEFTEVWTDNKGIIE
ncbi:MAG: rhodanese-like domain-containing protein [Oscillospiraceae bacterium]|nr:rhodanese-like domain-containing protein [Oscillospiraceae bacterium]